MSESYANITPDYSTVDGWELYDDDLLCEYKQCLDEGLDISEYESLFKEVASLPKSEIRKELGETLFKLVGTLKTVSDFKYNEPSLLEEIKKLQTPAPALPKLRKDLFEEKLQGAYLGRICGCLLGKTVEGIRSEELIPFLKETGNYPMHRYILRSDITDEICEKYRFGFKRTVYADEINGMVPDDDTNYTVLSQLIVEKYGMDFTPRDVAKAWLKLQPKGAYCTAERVAYCNFSTGYMPPLSAIYKNPYREFIGAQIRADYWGYINPGKPEKAADTAFKDACISHIKNGIYGEMLVAAMISAAASTDDIELIIETGLSQIPNTSRLFEAVTYVLNCFKNGETREAAIRHIHSLYDEHTSYGWCHTIPNAMIVTAALLYGEKDYRKSVCMAVEAAFDTDCNAATVGSVLGMALGKAAVPEDFLAPVNDTLYTTIFGTPSVNITATANKTAALAFAEE